MLHGIAILAKTFPGPIGCSLHREIETAQQAWNLRLEVEEALAAMWPALPVPIALMLEQSHAALAKPLAQGSQLARHRSGGGKAGDDLLAVMAQGQRDDVARYGRTLPVPRCPDARAAASPRAARSQPLRAMPSATATARTSSRGSTVSSEQSSGVIRTIVG